MAKQKLLKRLFFVWGGSGGFLIGAALMALLLRWLGGWPPSEAYLHRFLKVR
jgi:hypothetical protein